MNGVMLKQCEASKPPSTQVLGQQCPQISQHTVSSPGCGQQVHSLMPVLSCLQTTSSILQVAKWRWPQSNYQKVS